MPANDSIEDEFHCVIVKLIDGDGVEVAQEPWSYGVSPSTRRAHGSNQNNINKIDLRKTG